MPVHLSYHEHTLYGIHDVLSSVPKHAKSAHQAAAFVITTVDDFILLLYRMDHYHRHKDILFGKPKVLVVHIL